jgi:ubiquinone/menaquinone biosynthesis C-methylase UbiE
MDEDLLAFYDQGGEDPRLVEGGPSRIEYARTLDLLGRLLPAGPLDILDVGGGTGRYAAWLAERGHRVQLLDVVPLHLEQASARAAAGASYTVAWGDARELAGDDASFDVVLLMGPLYHLPKASDRQTALKEAVRVTRPGGVVICAAISRFASLMDGLEGGLLSDPVWSASVDAALTTGAHTNPSRHPDLFTTAYFHRPEELRAEATAAGLLDVRVYGIEGPGALLWPRWDNPDDRANILKVARLLETEPSVIGTSPHLLAVGQRATEARGTSQQ